MRLKKISNKAIAYACVGTLAVSSLAGVNFASVKADEESGTEAEVNSYKEVSIPWMVKEYDPGTDGDYKYLAGIDLAALELTSDYKYLQLTYTGDATAFDALRFEMAGADGSLGTYWFKENPQGTIKTSDDTLVADPSEEEQTAVIDLEKLGISGADLITTIHMHDSPGNGKFTIKEAKFTNSPKEVKSISIPWMAKEYNPGEGEGYQYLAGIDLADLNVTKDYQYLQLSYTGESTSFDELRFEVVGTDKGLGTFWFKENPQGTIKTVDDTLVANPTETEQTVVIDLAKSGITNAEGIATIHMHDTKGKGAFTITDAQFTNTPLQVAKTPVEPEETTPEETTPDNNGETTPETTTEKVIADGTNDIILNGDDQGKSAMIGTYSIKKGSVEKPNYKYLGWATFKDFANESYKYLKITYTGNIKLLRFEFEGKGGEKQGPFWFDPEQATHFVTEDGSAIPLVGNNTTVVINLAKSGVDMSKYNSGVHMHCSAEDEDVNISITDAVLYGGKKSEPQPTTTTAPTTKPTTVAPTTTQAAKVSVGKTAVKSATKKKSAKKASVVLKKVKGAKGYQVKISTSKKFKSKATKTITTAKVKFVVKKLKANKKYYVKARAYKVVNKAKVYGKWSAVKQVKNK